MPDVTYHPTEDRELRAYLAAPRGEGPWPGVVVIMDALGVSDDIRQQADLLAAAGYLALAPDLYSGRGPRCVVATLKASRSGSGEAYEDIEAARVGDRDVDHVSLPRSASIFFRISGRAASAARRPCSIISAAFQNSITH